MMKDISRDFPQDKRFFVKLRLSRLEGESFERFEYPKDPNLFKFLEGSFSSLGGLLRYEKIRIGEKNVYVIGSPRNGYRLAFRAGRRKEMKTYRSFGSIIFER